MRRRPNAVTSEEGDLVLLKADSEKMVELAKYRAIEGKTWNHSVVVGNRIFIRNAEERSEERRVGKECA